MKHADGNNQLKNEKLAAKTVNDQMFLQILDQHPSDNNNKEVHQPRQIPVTASVSAAVPAPQQQMFGAIQ